jgi:predicted metalloprotease with PDZ domain
MATHSNSREIMPRRFLTALCIGLLASVAAAPAVEAKSPAIRYGISWGAPNDHWLSVEMRISSKGSARLDVRIPYWRPGRYIVQNFARNVVSVSAATASGAPLPIRKVDRNTWRIATGGAREVVVRYRVWANQFDAGASYVGQGRLSLNPVTALMYVPGRETEPVTLALARPEGWEVKTALDFDEKLSAWRAADYHELVDSPVLAGTGFRTETFEARGARFEIVIAGDWSYDTARLVEHHRRIAEAQFDLMRDVPFDRYVFLYQFVPWEMGHGVEHRKSVSIVLGPPSMIPFPDDLSEPGFYGALLSVASHELFHAWNVERIRPAAMVPTDYGHEQYTSLMWIFEGTTDYYADLLLLRAGLSTPERFLRGMARTVGWFDADPGRRVTSIAMSSFDSWAKDDDAAPTGTFYSYYTAGKAMGLVFDLEVRGRTGGRKSLDDVVRLLNDRYARKGLGVPEDGFLRALDEVSGTSFKDLYAAYINTTGDIDWNAHLARAGMRLVTRPNTERPARLGVRLDGARITHVAEGSAAFRAGLDSADVIVAVNGAAVTDPKADYLAGNPPGEEVELTIERDGGRRIVRLVLDPSTPVYSIEPIDGATPEQVAIREAWLRQEG